MKKLLLGSLVLLMFSASIIVFNISCKKESNAQPSTQSNCIGPQPTLRFKGNGVLYECKGINDSRLGWTGYPFFDNSYEGEYGLTFSNYKDGVIFANFPNTINKVSGSINLGSTTLTVNTYDQTDQILIFENLNYRYENYPNRLKVTITQIRNGFASGTFSGVLPAATSGSSNSGPQMNITEGVFSNIPIFD